jgi:hypothetical protein
MHARVPALRAVHYWLARDAERVADAASLPIFTDSQLVQEHRI